MNNDSPILSFDVKLDTEEETVVDFKTALLAAIRIQSLSPDSTLRVIDASSAIH